jgi:hypothetical protein
MIRLLFLLAFLCLASNAEAANRFWVGGTGTWDAVTTTHWSATSGGAGGVSVPGSADTVTFDASSGGGTVTVNFGGLITIQSLTLGAFTGTLDFATNNNSITLTLSGTAASITGSGIRTLNMGSGTWTLSGSAATWGSGVTTNLTFNANTSTISMTGTGARTFQGGGLTFSTVSFSGGGTASTVNITSANTFATLNVAAGNTIYFPSGLTTTITNAFTWTGTSSNQIGIATTSSPTVATISVASGSPTMSWAGVNCITFQGGATFSATNSFDLKCNTGITITAPATGSSGGFIIGG